ncbi:MAG: porin [Roseiarcus sp.]
MALSPASLTALAALVAASFVNAAELPSRKATTEAAPVKMCEISGTPGYRLPGSNVCVKLSGYVSGQVSAGTLGK